MTISTPLKKTNQKAVGRFMEWNSFSKVRQCERAFTLIELLVVIAIVAILAALLSAGVSRMKTTANAAKCISNLRQLYVCAQAFSSDNDGYLPQAAWYLPRDFLGMAQFKYPSLVDYGADKIKGCPESPSLSLTSYGMNSRLIPYTYFGDTDWGPGQDRYYYRSPFRWANITKPAQTLLFSDTGADSVQSAYYFVSGLSELTGIIDVKGRNAWRHNGKFNAVFCDGHVQACAPDDPNIATFPYPWIYNAPPSGFNDFITQ